MKSDNALEKILGSSSQVRDYLKVRSQVRHPISILAFS